MIIDVTTWVYSQQFIEICHIPFYFSRNNTSRLKRDMKYTIIPIIIKTLNITLISSVLTKM